MKTILVLGAGQSAPYMIDYLLKQAEENDWFITVGDKDYNLAKQSINRHPRGNAVEFDVTETEMRSTHIKKSDVVINFLPPTFQYLLALDCINYGKHMITASYQDHRMKELNHDANLKGILILNEMGLDPGIDHMSAIALITRVREAGGRITEFKSYGSGLPAPEALANPFNYCITWNPRNVVMAGETGAQYLEDGHLKILPHTQVFNRTWTVELDGVGTMEAYPNRDSLVYRELFGLEQVQTMIRGTLRYPGWSETWSQIVKLGLPNEKLVIPNLREKTYVEYLEMFLPIHASGKKLPQRVANFLQINPTGKIMSNLKWLGLFSDEKITSRVETSTEVLVELLKKKLFLPPNTRDMVALMHEIDIEYSEPKPRKERITSTLVEYGQPDGFTAIAKTVGLPAAIAAKLVLQDKLPITGCQIPTHPAIYPPVLKELEENGLVFSERTETLE